MEEIIEGKDEDFYRKLLRSMSQNLDELKKEIEFFNQTYGDINGNTNKLNQLIDNHDKAQEELNKLTDPNGVN